MGDTGSDYPNGTLRLCNFEGKFTNVTKVGDYEYRMQIEYLRPVEPEGQTIEDGRRVIRTSETYGLGKPTDTTTGDVRLYLPGRSTQDLSDQFLTWVRQKNGSGSLDMYALHVFTDAEYGWMGPKS
jgi:hypothetical protein